MQLHEYQQYDATGLAELIRRREVSGALAAALEQQDVWQHQLPRQAFRPQAG